MTGPYAWQAVGGTFWTGEYNRPYTKTEWHGRTEDEVNEVYAAGDAYRIRIVRLIEAKLKEKNT